MSDGVRQPAAEQGDARFFLFLAAAADQAAGIAAEQQAVAEVRPQELRQPLDRGAVGGGDEGDREVECGRAGLAAPSCSAASAIAASSRAPRPMALAKDIGSRAFRRRHRLPREGSPASRGSDASIQSQRCASASIVSR